MCVLVLQKVSIKAMNIELEILKHLVSCKTLPPSTELPPSPTPRGQDFFLNQLVSCPWPLAPPTKFAVNAMNSALLQIASSHR